jgi:peptidoglycan/xylan/chitin deacetylase (PgdA/CDA1 family)
MTDPIPIRPRVDTPRWPAGFRSALTILVDAQGPQSDVAARYATTGLTRLLTLFADLGVRSTVIWTAESALAQPGLLQETRSQGHGTALTVHDISDPRQLGAALNDLAGRLAGPAPGIVLPDIPGPAANRINVLAATLADAGFGWVADTALGLDVPIRAMTAGQAVIRIPLPPRASDAGMDTDLVSDQFVVNWRDDLDVLRDEGNLQVLRLSAWRSGRPGTSRGITRFFDYATELGDVWMARADEIAGWWDQRERGAIPFSSETDSTVSERDDGGDDPEDQ